MSVYKSRGRVANLPGISRGARRIISNCTCKGQIEAGTHGLLEPRFVNQEKLGITDHRTNRCPAALGSYI